MHIIINEYILHNEKIIFIIVQTVIVQKVLVIEHFAIYMMIKDYIVIPLEEKNITFL